MKKFLGILVLFFVAGFFLVNDSRAAEKQTLTSGILQSGEGTPIYILGHIETPQSKENPWLAVKTEAGKMVRAQFLSCVQGKDNLWLKKGARVFGTAVTVTGTDKNGQELSVIFWASLNKTDGNFEVGDNIVFPAPAANLDKFDSDLHSSKCMTF